MELTAENFDETLERLSAKYLPGKNVKLTRQGIVWNFNDECKLNGDNNTLKVVNNLVKNIPRFFQKHSPIGKKYWNTNSSYGCKHILSSELSKENPQDDNYSANGEFILAMWILDYEMKPYIDKSEHYKFQGRTYVKDCNPNVTFNCSFRDLEKVLCKCGLQYTKASKKQHEKSKSHHLIMNAIKKHTTHSLAISPPSDSTTGQLV